MAAATATRVQVQEEPTMKQFYGELATWWPLISPLEDYGAECAEILVALRERRPDARTLLELGSGGGHVAAHLRDALDCTLTDLSPAMIEVSRRLNPDCPHHVADMRYLRLNAHFDLVLAHDAIDYMTSEADLRAAFTTAFAHLRPGGLALFLPDDVQETYEPGGTDVSGVDGPDGRAARLFEWAEAPQADGTVAVHYSFLLREPRLFGAPLLRAAPRGPLRPRHLGAAAHRSGLQRRGRAGEDRGRSAAAAALFWAQAGVRSGDGARRRSRRGRRRLRARGALTPRCAPACSIGDGRTPRRRATPPSSTPGGPGIGARGISSSSATSTRSAASSPRRSAPTPPT
jgi:SAM-dependent methyltransferase